MPDQPLARGTDAALPYAGVFHSGHDFESLQELARAVAVTAGQE